tara:strand:- start:2698 stop:4008 length:1311 start_codon:yes stop_codon:yes gene_type:complete
MNISLGNRKLSTNFSIQSFGFFCFLTGVFFLASAVGISMIFLLISQFVSFTKPSNFLKDKWNYPLFLSAFFMSISTLVHFLRYEKYIDLGLDPKLSLLGLINWFPFFLCFWGFQKYLNSSKKRLITSKILICSSIPVIFSGILQLLNINGPFELFNGLIVWFQKPLSDIGSLSGLFNNQNYAGLWMVLVWPFCLSELNRPKRNFYKKIILIIICFSFVTFISLTDSRNAFLGLIISTPIVLGSANLIWYLPTILFGFTLLALCVMPIFPNEIQVFMKSIIPSRIYTLFPEIGLANLGTYPRINKWVSSLNYILQNPIFGWGAASFPILYYSKSGEWFGHSHNLPFELAISYGLISSIIIFSFYILILFFSFKKIYKYSKIKDKNIEFFLNQKAWFAASLILLLSHLVDIQYFDVRISTLFWILLAGLRSSFKEDIL